MLEPECRVVCETIGMPHLDQRQESIFDLIRCCMGTEAQRLQGNAPVAQASECVRGHSAGAKGLSSFGGVERHTGSEVSRVS